ncbi:helix-turn-helix domain-containing protein [Streptomyces sp. NPDC006197]|uniref:helix-turn-helix domain-containing protein n=1 Tax=Streptomyces sp. NPDC006197 TaxID=3156685 RepID=UPI0033B3021D
MTEVARVQGSSSEVERGEVPEVAALGNVLKELFNRLGISQNQYAYRVHLDKSAVSRYLAGRRVAPQDFIDRLVREIEDHVGAPLQLEAKEALRDRRLEALRVCSPDEYRLESLRDELARSRRDTERAHRNIEALHALLDKKEAEAQDIADDLTRLRLDWGAERTALARAQEDLRHQVEQLRQDLQDAEHLRQEAERHTADLRETVLRLEEELSRTGAGDLPLEAFKSRLLALWDEDDFPGAARELAEAAWSRPLEEVRELLGWLRKSVAVTTVETFVADLARMRHLEDVPAIAEEVAGIEQNRIRNAWASALSARLTDRNAAAVYQGLRSTQGDHVLGEALRQVASDADAVALVLAALAGSPSSGRLTRTSLALVRARGRDRQALRVLVGLAEAGRPDVAARLLFCLLEIHRFVRLAQQVRALDDAQIDVLFDLVTRLDDTDLMTAFAMGMTLDRALLDRLLTMMAARGRLDLLDLTTFEELKTAVTRWRRSRGQ